MNFFFFNDTATTEIYTLPLHDALPICLGAHHADDDRRQQPQHRAVASAEAVEGLPDDDRVERGQARQQHGRSEEHTSELQSRQYLVCRLLLEKKKNKYFTLITHFISIL